MPELNSYVPEPARQPELAVGAVVGGKYQIDGVLGSGGMGVVLSATHLELGAPVAIKVVRDELARNEEVVARMLFEARAAAKLRGSHVVRVMDVARLESGAPYIVMEHLVGRDLAGLLIERGALPIQDAVDYLLQACEGLAEAHALGIVHRDLKPENLFLASTPEGVVVKILDFGISKEIGPVARIGPRTALTTAGCAVGSPYYMSPEQMRASQKVDTRADIWSLGAILFELLTGRCPFEGETMPMVYANVLNEEAPALRSFSAQAPEQLDAIVRCCLQKDPELRFESVAALALALREFASADGQRGMDRSARLASGISVKQDRRSASSMPHLDALRLSACSSPTLQSAMSSTPIRGSALPHAEVVGRPSRKRLGALAVVAATVVLAGSALAARQFARTPHVIPAQPAAMVELVQVPPTQLAPSPTVLVADLPLEAPPPTDSKPPAATRKVSRPAPVSTPVAPPKDLAVPGAPAAARGQAANSNEPQAAARPSEVDRLGGRY